MAIMIYGLYGYKKYFVLAKKQEILMTDVQWLHVLKSADRTIVGHIPKLFSKVFWYFLSHGRKISCEVTAKRKYGKGLEVPCVYTFLGSEKMVLKLKAIMQENPCVLLYLTPNRIKPHLSNGFSQCHYILKGFTFHC